MKKWLVSLGLLIWIVGCSRAPEPEPGNLYSWRDGAGDYRVMKMVAVDEEGIWAMIFSTKWKERPHIVDVSLLPHDEVSNEEVNKPWSSVMLFDRGLYRSLKPKFMQIDQVTTNDLARYQSEKDAQQQDQRFLKK